MGNCMRKKGPGQKLTLAILGLDNAGKTVTTKGLKGDSLDTVAPTIGFSSIDFSFENYDITLFDLGGGKRIRDIWKDYFSEIYGLIYVIDSSEPDRMEECRGVLEKLLEHEKVSGKPTLVLANKQDKPGALDEYDICEQLDLEELVNTHKTPCRVELCAAIIGQGKKLDKSIKQGMRWLLKTIEKNHEVLDARVKKDFAKQQEIEKEQRRQKAERVRKIKEERRKKEKEERRLRGEPDSESENEPENGDPFKLVDRKALEEKEQRLKEEKKRKKEALLNRSFDDSPTDKPSYDDPKQLLKQRQLRSLDDSDISPARGKKPGFMDSPRPFRRSSYGQSRSRSPSPPGRNETGSLSSPWNRTPRPLDLTSPLGVSKLPPLGQNDLNSGARRGILAPIGQLEPLESLDYAAIDKKPRKKKRKARKNQTMPGENGNADAGYDEPDMEPAAPRGWPTPGVRASRSPRLDTVQEPDNETDSNAHKWGLADDLPGLEEEEEEVTQFSSRRYRPNSDAYDLVT